MDIQEIKRRTELLQKITQKRLVLISDVAKELKVRATDLMIFIQDNPGLFHTDKGEPPSSGGERKRVDYCNCR